MPTFKLGRGNDVFYLPPRYDGALDVHGGSGNDYIDARGQPYLGGGGSNATAYGDSGGDTLLIGGVWASNSSAYGGGGADILSASGGYQFTLDGGSGADILTSESAPMGRSYGWAGEGTRMTGGSGRDTFVLDSNTGNYGALNVSAPAASDGALVEGEVISGLIDVITDYRRGELIDLPGTQTLGDVSRVVESWTPWGWLHTEAGEYGLVRGDLTGSGRFTVADDGPDMLLVYQQDEYSRVDGAVVILGGASSDLLIG